MSKGSAPGWWACRRWELFERQPAAYHNNVLPPSVTARIAIEAGRSLGWRTYVGDRGAIVGLDRFGASAPALKLFQEFGLTPERVAARAAALLLESRGAR